MNIFEKIKFIWKKPKVVIVTGEGRACVKEAIYQVLKQYFKIGNEILLFESDLTNSTGVKKFKFLVKNSSLPILVVTQVGDIPPDKDFFAGEKEKTIKIRNLTKKLPSFGYLILNFDDETVREIKAETNLKDSNPPEDGSSRYAGSSRVPTTLPLRRAPITFGFQEKAEFRASDINLNGGTNFKLNYKGNVIPIWLEKLFGKEQIYSVLAATAVGTILGLNLVEISQALKNYYSLPGKMRLIEGIKDSKILDDSESATVFSMVEAIEILGKIQGFKRKIAVLGDVIGIGKYTVDELRSSSRTTPLRGVRKNFSSFDFADARVIEAHEAIGERVAKNVDLLFTFGARAKFISQGVQNKGMALEKIFQFDKIEDGIIKLKEEIKEGDLILVDGSKEMEMGEIVKEIKAVG